MAPELRKRKSLSEAQKSNGATKAADKPTPKGKRKAAEDASPVSIKKQKATKKAAPTPKAANKPPKEAKPAKASKKEAQKDEDILQVDDGSDGSDGEENDKAKKLAAEVDSEDEAPVDLARSYKPGQGVGKPPAVSKDLVKLAKQPTGEPGVVYIGRIPHGFYEHEMRQYLEQFGPVTRVRLSRNKKTGASKHFAFVEFEESSTAEIVAKTMDNYLLFGHILKCKTIPKEQVHDDLFKGANKRYKAVPLNKMAGIKLEKPRSESTWKSKVSKEKSKRAKQAAKFKDMGYDFEAPDMKEVPPPQPAEVDEPAKAIEGAPAEEEQAAAKEETKTSKKTKTKQIEAKPETIPVLEKKVGKVAKGKGKKVKA